MCPWLFADFKKGLIMKMFSKSTVLAGVTAALLGFSMSASANGDPNDPNNWNQVPDTGSITVGPPDFVTLIGSNIGDGGTAGFHNTSFTIAASSAPQTTVTFDWHYVTDDIDPFWDLAYFVKGGAQFQLPTDGGGGGGDRDQMGSRSFSVGAGEVFGFSIVTTDATLGAATLTISNFQASPVPEPGSLAMLTMGLMVVAAARKRRRA